LTYKEAITEQELKDRYVASECLKYLLNRGKFKVKIKPAGITSHIDLRCKMVDQDRNETPFYVEIKERYKDDVKLEEYPFAELKVEKYNRMEAITPDNTFLYYMVLLNEEKCMMFNLHELDWSRVKTVIWHIKKTQYWDQSYYVDTPVYMIPYDMAEAECDCTKYYEDYYRMIGK
jgi:hypothetical protein